MVVVEVCNSRGYVVRIVNSKDFLKGNWSSIGFFIREIFVESLMNFWRVMWRVISIVLYFVISRYFKIILVLLVF